MTRFSTIISATVLAGSVICQPVSAEAPFGTSCGDRTRLVEHLGATFGERRVGHGLAENGAAIEVFAGPGGSFTVVTTNPRGTSCLIATGEAWEPLPQPERYAAR